MVVNGQGQPRLIVVDVSHPVTNPLATILLPFCKKLSQTWDQVYTTHDVQKGKLAKGKGWRLTSAKLDYSEHLDGQTLLDMAQAFSIADLNDTQKMLVLVPRVDTSEIHYNVKWNNSMEISTIFDVGHGDVVFEFEGLDIEPQPPFVGTGYGTHYGGNGDGYGSEL